MAIEDELRTRIRELREEVAALKAARNSSGDVRLKADLAGLQRQHADVCRERDELKARVAALESQLQTAGVATPPAPKVH